QDRAVVRRPPRRARRGQTLQRALHALEIADPLLDDVDLLSGFPLDGIAGGAVPDAQPEQLLDLLQRETELLSVLDEAQARHRVIGVLAISSRSAPRRRKEAAPLVIADRLDVHVGRVRDLTNAQRHSCALPEALGQDRPYTKVEGQGVHVRIVAPPQGVCRVTLGVCALICAVMTGWAIARH